MLNPYDSLDRMLLDSRRVSMGEKWFLGVFLHGVGLFFVVSGPANVQAYSYRESVGAPVPLRTGKPLSHGQGQAWLSMKQINGSFREVSKDLYPGVCLDPCASPGDLGHAEAKGRRPQSRNVPHVRGLAQKRKIR